MTEKNDKKTPGPDTPDDLEEDGRDQYDRADGRGAYRRDPAEREDGAHPESGYGAARDEDMQDDFDGGRHAEKRKREEEKPVKRNIPKNTGRGVIEDRDEKKSKPPRRSASSQEKE